MALPGRAHDVRRGQLSEVKPTYPRQAERLRLTLVAVRNLAAHAPHRARCTADGKHRTSADARQ
jgi:hypothetical protein